MNMHSLIRFYQRMLVLMKFYEILQGKNFCKRLIRSCAIKIPQTKMEMYRVRSY